jgi:hypothetical protein
LEAGAVVISGAVGRTDVRVSATGAADGVPAALAGDAAGGVGGPIEIGDIAGRDFAGPLAPMSMDRETMTAGVGGAGPGTVAAGFATGLAGWAVGALAFPGVVGLRGVRCCADFADGEDAFCDWAFGCGDVPAPRPSFGGRCIDGSSSSAVLVDGASVAPLGLPEKSLEKTLIAEHQR